MLERMSGEGEEENGERRKGMIEQEQREGEERLWNDVIMRRINSKTGVRGRDLPASGAIQSTNFLLRMAVDGGMGEGGARLQGLGQAAQLRVEE